MLYRFALTIGLLLTPLASAHAAYQQHYTLPSATDTTTNSEQNTTTSSAPDPLTGSWIEISDGTMTRAQFTAALVHSLYTQDQIDHCFRSIAPKLSVQFTLVFTDVTVNDPYAAEICLAMRDGLVRGFTDGSFAPNRVITFAESAKILSRTFVLAPYADADVKSAWYMQHIHALLVRNAIPTSITRLNQAITQDELNEMLDRLQHGITWRASQTESVLFPSVRVKTSAPVSPVTGSSSSTASDAMSVSSIPSSKPVHTSSAASSKTETSSAVSSKKSFWHMF